MANKSVRLVYCLSIDLIRSTQAGLELPTPVLDRFNHKLVHQLTPHLASVGLDDALLKFTGDGWLVMTDEPVQAAALCCLATIMAETFQAEMSRDTGIAAEKIPPLRLAVCAGRDVRVELPDGRRDWVGDSARRAVRASEHCDSNEIIIDEPTRFIVFRDFNTRIKNIGRGEAGPLPEKDEEEFTLYTLGELKTEAATDFEAPEYFVNTLSLIGRQADATALAEHASEQLEHEAIKLTTTADKEHLLIKWHRLMSSRLEYPAALDILKNIRDAGLVPNVYTYSILISKSPDHTTAKAWLKEMRAEGVEPNVVTYSTLINFARDYQEAMSILERMRAEGVEPDVVTYNTLLKFATSYDEAEDIMDAMHAEGVEPNVVTYSTLINLAPDDEEADKLVAEMRVAGIRPSVVTYNTLINFAGTYEDAQSLIGRMHAEGVEPNVVTFNTLINFARDYDQAQSLIGRMRAEGVKPDVVTYSTLFSKDLSSESADDILGWYLSQKYHHEAPIQAAIASYQRARQTDQALRLALDYPHLQAARKLIRLHADEAVSYFKSVYDSDAQHPNGSYALGVALMELGRDAEARPYLLQALELARSGPRQESIRKWLRQIGLKHPRH